MPWIILWLYANVCLGARTPYGLNIWSYSLLNFMWTEKSGLELPVCAGLGAGGGEHQNSEWEGNTCCHQDSLHIHFHADDEAVFGQWQTVYNNISSGELPKDCWDANGQGFLTRVCSDTARGNGFKMKESRLRLDSRKKILLWGWWDWKKLPREAVNAPSLEVFKDRLHRSLNSLV